MTSLLFLTRHFIELVNEVFLDYIFALLINGLITYALCKQTKRNYLYSFNLNFLEPRPTNMHESCEQIEVKLIRYHFLEGKYSANFICKKCLAKTVQS